MEPNQVMDGAAAAEAAERDQVLAWLRQGGGNFDAGAARTGLPAEVVARVVAELQAEGKLPVRRRRGA